MDVLHDCCFLFSSNTLICFFFFFFNDTATTEIYTLSLHDALPILMSRFVFSHAATKGVTCAALRIWKCAKGARSEEHTSELQSQSNLVCRLLLEKKKQHQTSPCPSDQHLPITSTTCTIASLRALAS